MPAVLNIPLPALASPALRKPSAKFRYSAGSFFSATRRLIWSGKLKLKMEHTAGARRPRAPEELDAARSARTCAAVDSKFGHESRLA
eukprot:scaffold127766_cov60-Phaeocystis_antarctica.AAC.2